MEIHVSIHFSFRHLENSNLNISKEREKSQQYSLCSSYLQQEIKIELGFSIVPILKMIFIYLKHYSTFISFSIDILQRTIKLLFLFVFQRMNLTIPWAMCISWDTALGPTLLVLQEV